MAKLSLNRRRAIVGFVGIPSLFCAANWKLGLNLLGAYDKIAGYMGFAALVLVVVFVAMPAYPELKRDWEETKAKRDKEDRGQVRRETGKE